MWNNTLLGNKHKAAPPGAMAPHNLFSIFLLLFEIIPI
jgi:hypothetical protein